MFLILAIILAANISYGQKVFYRHIQNTDGSASTAGFDTVFVADFSRVYALLSMTIRNAGAVACTLTVQGGIVNRTEEDLLDEWKYSDKAQVDVAYYNICVRDSTWGIATEFILNAESTVRYWFCDPNVELIKCTTTQTSGADVDFFFSAKLRK